MGDKFLQCIQEAFIGFVLAPIILIFAVSDAALAFSGGVSSHLAHGIGMMMASTTVVTFIVSMTSPHKQMIATTQDTSVIILAVVSGALLHQLDGSADQLFPTFMMFIIISSMITGLVIVLMGRLKLGNFARFIPHQVLGGFLLGVGLMIIITSWIVMTGKEFDVYKVHDYLRIDSVEQWGPAVVAALIFLGITRFYTKVLVFPILIVAMIAIFYVVIAVSGISIDQVQSRGVLLGPFPEGALLSLPSVSFIDQANWNALFAVSGNIIVLAILTPLSLLLNISGIEAEAKTDISLDKELQNAGFANFISPFFGGGVISYQSIVATEMSDKLGAKTRFAGVVLAVLLVLLLIYGIDLIGLFPRFIVAGMILYLGIELSMNWLYDFKSKFTLSEYGTMIFIGVMIVSFGFLEGVGIGTLIALVIFVVKYSRVQMIKQSLKGSYIHSNVERDTRQRETLSKKGDSIHLFKLHGFMFFGNAHEFLKAVVSLSREHSRNLKYVVLDLKGIEGLDSSSIYSFSKMYHYLQELNIVLVFTQVPSDLKKVLLPHISKDEEEGKIHIFDDIDYGLEWCENQLLKSEGYSEENRLTLYHYLQDFVDNESKVQAVLDELDSLSAEEGYTLFRQGELSDDVYFLDSGYVEVILESESGQKIRLRSIGPGTVVGEIGFYLNEARSATVVTVKPCEMYRLSKSKLQKLKTTDPEIAFILEECIIRQLASRLVYENQQVQGLLSNG